MPHELYSIFGVRPDGSRRLLVDGVPHKTAVKIMSLVDEGIFKEVVLEPDLPKGTSQGTRSVELFPPNVQPPPGR